MCHLSVWKEGASGCDDTRPTGEFLLPTADLLLTYWVAEPSCFLLLTMFRCLGLFVSVSAPVVALADLCACVVETVCMHACVCRKQQHTSVMQLSTRAQCGKGSWVPSTEVGNPLSDLACGAACQADRAASKTGRQCGVQRPLYAYGAVMPLSEMMCWLGGASL